MILNLHPLFQELKIEFEKILCRLCQKEKPRQERKKRDSSHVQMAVISSSTEPNPKYGPEMETFFSSLEKPKETEDQRLEKGGMSRTRQRYFYMHIILRGQKSLKDEDKITRPPRPITNLVKLPTRLQLCQNERGPAP